MKVKTIILVIFVAAMGTHVFAAPTIDGRFDPSEGYTTGHYLDLLVEGYGYAADQGQLWRHQDSSDNLYVAFIQPTSLIDNSYGDNRIGWGAKEHFLLGKGGESLIGSDKAEITIKDGLGNVLFAFKMDYIAEKKGVPSGTNPYVSAGVQENSAGYDQSQGKMVTGNAVDMLEWSTSQEYNMNTYYKNDPLHPSWILTDDSPTADPDYTNIDPTYSNWVFEVIYEFKVDGSILAGYGDDFSIDVVHDSPNKLGKNKVWPEIDGVIPAPGAILLGGIGVVLVGWLRRRRTL